MNFIKQFVSNFLEGSLIGIKSTIGIFTDAEVVQIFGFITWLLIMMLPMVYFLYRLIPEAP